MAGRLTRILVLGCLLGCLVGCGTSRRSHSSIYSNTSASTSVDIYPSKASSGDDVVSYARTFMGKPYKYGASGPSAFDCSGFTSYVYRKFGYTLGRSSKDQWSDGVKVDRGSLRPGDLVFFGKGSISHVGIVVEAQRNGDFRFIHSSSSIGITISDSDNSYWKTRYWGARRVLR